MAMLDMGNFDENLDSLLATINKVVKGKKDRNETLEWLAKVVGGLKPDHDTIWKILSERSL